MIWGEGVFNVLKGGTNYLNAPAFQNSSGPLNSNFYILIYIIAVIINKAIMINNLLRYTLTYLLICLRKDNLVMLAVLGLSKVNEVGYYVTFDLQKSA